MHVWSGFASSEVFELVLLAISCRFQALNTWLFISICASFIVDVIGKLTNIEYPIIHTLFWMMTVIGGMIMPKGNYHFEFRWRNFQCMPGLGYMTPVRVVFASFPNWSSLERRAPPGLRWSRSTGCLVHSLRALNRRKFCRVQQQAGDALCGALHVWAVPKIPLMRPFAAVYDCDDGW
jgi:hypothetical protein